MSACCGLQWVMRMRNSSGLVDGVGTVEGRREEGLGVKESMRIAFMMPERGDVHNILPGETYNR